MSKFTVGSIAVAIAALVVSPALADEPPAKRRAKAAPVMRAAPPPPPPVFTWTGCYIGGTVGLAFQDRNTDLFVENDPANPFFNPTALAGVNAEGSYNLASTSFTGGVQAGCNWQTGIWVWGAEIDWNTLNHDSHLGGERSFITTGGPYFLDVYESKHWFATARLKAGFAIDKVFLYFTAGVAVLDHSFAQTFSSAITPIWPRAEADYTQAGWVVGVGGEINIYGPWSAKAEYLYAHFDGDTVISTLASPHSFRGTGRPGGATFYNELSDVELHVFRVGINYKFGTGYGIGKGKGIPAPVVTK